MMTEQPKLPNRLMDDERKKPEPRRTEKPSKA